jgi:hypothetical protein
MRIGCFKGFNKVSVKISENEMEWRPACWNVANTSMDVRVAQWPRKLDFENFIFFVDLLMGVD